MPKGLRPLIAATMAAACALASATVASAEVDGKSHVYYFDGVSSVNGLVTCKLFFRSTAFPGTSQRTVNLNGNVQCYDTTTNAPKGITFASVTVIPVDQSNNWLNGGQTFSCYQPLPPACGTPAGSFDFGGSATVNNGTYVNYRIRGVRLVLAAAKPAGGVQEGSWLEVPIEDGCVPVESDVTCLEDFWAYDPEKFPDNQIPPY